VAGWTDSWKDSVATHKWDNASIDHFVLVVYDPKTRRTTKSFFETLEEAEEARAKVPRRDRGQDHIAAQALGAGYQVVT
jgi:hypothetical protein